MKNKEVKRGFITVICANNFRHFHKGLKIGKVRRNDIIFKFQRELTRLSISFKCYLWKITTMAFIFPGKLVCLFNVCVDAHK